MQKREKKATGKRKYVVSSPLGPELVSKMVAAQGKACIEACVKDMGYNLDPNVRWQESSIAGPVQEKFVGGLLSVLELLFGDEELQHEGAKLLPLLFVRLQELFLWQEHRDKEVEALLRVVDDMLSENGMPAQSEGGALDVPKLTLKAAELKGKMSRMTLGHLDRLAGTRRTLESSFSDEGGVMAKALGAKAEAKEELKSDLRWHLYFVDANSGNLLEEIKTTWQAAKANLGMTTGGTIRIWLLKHAAWNAWRIEFPHGKAKVKWAQHWVSGTPVPVSKSLGTSVTNQQATIGGSHPPKAFLQMEPHDEPSVWTVP